MPNLRTLPTVLASLAFSNPGLVLYQEGDYWRVEDISARARREAASGHPKTREFLSRDEFWVQKDSKGKIVIMRMTSQGPLAYAAEPGSDRAADTRMTLGRKIDCAGAMFERRCYDFGQIYALEDLPSESQRDAQRQADELEYVFGRPVADLSFRLSLISHRDLMKLLEQEYGARLHERMESKAVRKLAASIEREGLKHAPVVDEGWKRALALASLGMDMPFFAAVPPVEFEFQPQIPTLEGRRGH